MRIAVLGCGRQGICCAADLLREEDVTELLLLDSRQEALQESAARLGNDRVRLIEADAADETSLVASLRGCDVAVSALPYFLNLAATRACIRAGVSMTDMGGNTDVVFQQRSLDGEAKAAGVAIIPDLGLAPGLGNILAAHAIHGTDRVDELRIRCGGLPLHPEPPLGYALFFSIHGLLNEYAGESVCLRDGRIVRIPTLTEVESIRFPKPVGDCEAAHTSGGTSTLPWTLEGKVRTLDYKTVRYPGHWARIGFLAQLGLLGTRPVKVGRATLPPREIASALLLPLLDRGETRDVVVLRLTMEGRRKRRVVTRQIDIQETGDAEGGWTAMMKLTAYPTAAVALSLARGAIAGRGVLAAETAVDPIEMMRHLESRGIRTGVRERFGKPKR